MRWWIKLIAVLIVVAVLAALTLSLGNSLMDVLNGAKPDSEPDPMFAQQAETVTRPPELYAEETQRPHKTLDDYVPEVQTPVDKTADELIREAMAG